MTNMNLRSKGNAMKTPTCPTCTTREVSVDTEGGAISFFSYCYECSNVWSQAPYCSTPECSAQVCGTRTTLRNPGPAVTVESASYGCDRCNVSGTATELATISGARTAQGDFDSYRSGDYHAFLIEARMSLRGIGGGYNAEHPVRRAYSRSYVDTALGLLTGVAA